MLNTKASRLIYYVLRNQIRYLSVDFKKGTMYNSQKSILLKNTKQYKFFRQ